jgi:hypothetical protein
MVASSAPGLVVDLTDDTGDTNHAERDAEVSYGIVRVYVRSRQSGGAGKWHDREWS